MRDLVVRPYERGDEQAVIALWLDCGLVVPHNNPSQDIERKLRIRPEWFLVGTLKGRVVATCMAGYEGHRGWINYLAVSPWCQRKGIATVIMKEAERMLIEAGCPKINVQIRTSNEDVIGFYESMGYAIDAVVSMGKRVEVDEPYDAGSGT